MKLKKRSHKIVMTYNYVLGTSQGTGWGRMEFVLPVRHITRKNMLEMEALAAKGIENQHTYTAAKVSVVATNFIWI